MNKKLNPAFSTFSGTVDELIANMDKVDVDQVERVVVQENEEYLMSDEEAISMIMSETNVAHDEAEDILNDIKREEVKRVCDNLLEQGIIEVASYDESGDPCYSLTENGKVLAKTFGPLKK